MLPKSEKYAIEQEKIGNGKEKVSQTNYLCFQRPEDIEAYKTKENTKNIQNEIVKIKT